ncbi:hypothetical protein C8J56DRAFT_773103, partial [Mycena floridula]
IIPHNVATCWNSTYDMLVFTIQYKAAIDDITNDKDTPLHKFDLSKAECTISIACSLLLIALKIFKDATVFFSSDNVPTIASVIPIMDRIDDMLTKSSAAGQPTLATIAIDDIHPSVKMALLLAKKTLNQYYGCTDESNVYRTAMSMSVFFNSLLYANNLPVLHLGLKTAYFRQCKWQNDWIDTTVSIVCDEFADYAAMHAAHDQDEVMEIAVCFRCC